MFLNNLNMIEMDKDIYLYKNFLSQYEIEDISSYLDSQHESKWFKISEEIAAENIHLDEKLNKIRDRIVSLLPEKTYLGNSLQAVRMLKGQFWYEHADVHDWHEVEKLANSYVEGTPFEEKELPIYGVVVYLNNFIGGEIYYTNQNLTYKPNAGDMIIHGSSEMHTHGVKEVKSEKRYSYSNHIYKKIKVSK